MYEQEEERKTEDSRDAKETRDAVMIVGGRGGGEKAGVAKTGGEGNRDTRNADLRKNKENTRASTKSPCVAILGMI